MEVEAARAAGGPSTGVVDVASVGLWAGPEAEGPDGAADLSSRNSPQQISSDQDSGLDMDMDNSPPPPKVIPKGTVCLVDADPYADEPDETLSERLWGLTEMVPECVRNATHVAVTSTMSGIKTLYSFSRNVSWIVASSSVILLAPVIFEVERVKVQEIQKNQQKQFLLGPSAAMVGPTGGVPSPPLPR